MTCTVAELELLTYGVVENLKIKNHVSQSFHKSWNKTKTKKKKSKTTKLKTKIDFLKKYKRRYNTICDIICVKISSLTMNISTMCHNCQLGWRIYSLKQIGKVLLIKVLFPLIKLWVIWVKVLKNGPSKICGIQPLKKYVVIWSA